MDKVQGNRTENPDVSVLLLSLWSCGLVCEGKKQIREETT